MVIIMALPPEMPERGPAGHPPADPAMADEARRLAALDLSTRLRRDGIPAARQASQAVDDAARFETYIKDGTK